MYTLAGVGLAALLVGLGIAWVLAGVFTRPLREFAAAAEQVAKGNLDVSADVSGSRDQREVAEIFNQMTARLKRVLAAQKEFVANASHQLRTPLTGLRLRLEAAHACMLDPAALREEIAAAEHETERLARLLTGLLTLAREGDPPVPPEPVPLAAAVENALERWEPTAAREGRSLVAARGEGVGALASAQDVAVTLDNLIENALRYSPPGSTITVQWGRRGDAATLAVLDEGPGIEPGEEDRVFERFVRGSAGSAIPGTGLGLSIVRALARRWGGDARIVNRAAGGACAEVELPCAVLAGP
jgi:signal transduction histidine kinase